MPVVAVVNRKGGSGKSTLATHLAAHLANGGLPVLLGDVDRQQSTQTWLRLRKSQRRSAIVGWKVDPRSVVRPPAGISHVILDTPGGLTGFDLARVVMYADAILIPVCNSVFDRESAAACFAELMTLPRIASGRCKVAAVGMRLDGRTKAGDVLAQWARGLQLPFVGVLRETQAYVRCVEQGLTLFDLPASKVETDMAQWAPILQWLDPVLNPVRATETVKSLEPATHPATAPERRPALPSKPIQQPVPSPTLQKRSPAPQRGPVVFRLEDTVRGPNVATRIGRLLDTLSIPRFLQRNS
jgi:chromosome partitioning protein